MAYENAHPRVKYMAGAFAFLALNLLYLVSTDTEVVRAMILG